MWALIRADNSSLATYLPSIKRVRGPPLLLHWSVLLHFAISFSFYNAAVILAHVQYVGVYYLEFGVRNSWNTHLHLHLTSSFPDLAGAAVGCKCLSMYV